MGNYSVAPVVDTIFLGFLIEIIKYLCFAGNSEMLTKKEVAKKALSILCNISFGTQVEVAAAEIVKPTAQQHFAAQISK